MHLKKEDAKKILKTMNSIKEDAKKILKTMNSIKEDAKKKLETVSSIKEDAKRISIHMKYSKREAYERLKEYKKNKY